MTFLGAVTQEDVFYFGILILIVFLILFVASMVGWWLTRERPCPCPYTDVPLRKASDLSWSAREKVLRFIYDFRDYYNRLIDFEKAAYCRETGRVFPDCVTWYGAIKVDWNFITHRCPGTFISWGSLPEDRQLIIRDKHHSLEGFQTDFSSSEPSPRRAPAEYAYTKPGPLYVDPDTGVLAGWKCVPDTELEVFVIQKPKEIVLPGIHKKYD